MLTVALIRYPCSKYTIVAIGAVLFHKIQFVSVKVPLSWSIAPPPSSAMLPTIVHYKTSLTLWQFRGGAKRNRILAILLLDSRKTHKNSIPYFRHISSKKDYCTDSHMLTFAAQDDIKQERTAKKHLFAHSWLYSVKFRLTKCRR